MEISETHKVSRKRFKNYVREEVKNCMENLKKSPPRLRKYEWFAIDTLEELNQEG